MTVQNGEPRVFHLFPLLPKELRLQIWEEVCSVERIVSILPGLGHLSPITHHSLAVPPLLHVCAESRQVGLHHYDLSFHRNVYLNRNYDLVLFHVFFPHQTIDLLLYLNGAFHWSTAPKRIAVLLDDCSFHKPLERGSDDRIMGGRTEMEGMYHRQINGRFERQHRLHFSDDFIASLYRAPLGNASFEELVLLVVPPLTARPNPVAQRIELLHNAPEWVKMGHFFTRELKLRAKEYDFRWRNDDAWTAPEVSVRFATCTPWPVISRNCQPIRRYTLSEAVAIGIGNDISALKNPFDQDVGLGPHVIWERYIWGCGTGAMRSPYCYEGTMRSLWRSADEDEDEDEDEYEDEDWHKGRIKTYRRNGIPWSAT